MGTASPLSIWDAPKPARCGRKSRKSPTDWFYETPWPMLPGIMVP
jgi:hypothetical protein